MSDEIRLFTFAREQSPEKDGTYECLIHDYEGGPYIYTEPVNYKDGYWQDFAEIIGWREIE